MNINDPKIQKLMKSGKLRAMVKDVAGRRMLVGLERNKRSRKYRVKHITAPVDLDQLGKPAPLPVDPATIPPMPEVTAGKTMPIDVTPPPEQPPMKNPPPPPNQAVVEMLAMAPNLVTLLPMVAALRKNFSHAPKLSRAMWQKTADDRLLLFINEAEDFDQVTNYHHTIEDQTVWPTTDRTKRKFLTAINHRMQALNRRLLKQTDSESHYSP